MPQKRRKLITSERWIEAAEAYELGYKHAHEIATELGVSPSTVSREFKRRGCRKGCRASETAVALEADLDRKARVRAAAEQAQEQAAWERTAAMDRLIIKMMRELLAADRAGNLLAVAPTMRRVAGSLRVKLAQ